MLLPELKGYKLRVYIVGREVSSILKQYSALIESVPEYQNLLSDDRGVLALAFKASSTASQTVYVVTVDTQLLNTVNKVLDIAHRLKNRVIESLKKLRPLTPSQLLQDIERDSKGV